MIFFLQQRNVFLFSPFLFEFFALVKMEQCIRFIYESSKAVFYRRVDLDTCLHQAACPLRCCPGNGLGPTHSTSFRLKSNYSNLF